MRLLIIDDDKELCVLLEEFLAREGIEAEFVHNGRAGLDRIRDGGIDLVVLDVMLPGMDGFEVLRAIRRESNVPVVMLTARGEDADRDRGAGNGRRRLFAETVQRARTPRAHPRRSTAWRRGYKRSSKTSARCCAMSHTNCVRH
jgi:two-component system response regulator CpxR